MGWPEMSKGFNVEAEALAWLDRIEGTQTDMIDWLVDTYWGSEPPADSDFEALEVEAFAWARNNIEAFALVWGDTRYAFDLHCEWAEYATAGMI